MFIISNFQVYNFAFSTLLVLRTLYISKWLFVFVFNFNGIDHLSRLQLKETSRFQILFKIFISIQKFAFRFGHTKILIRLECWRDFIIYWFKFITPAHKLLFIQLYTYWDIQVNEIGSAKANLFISVFPQDNW